MVSQLCRENAASSSRGLLLSSSEYLHATPQGTNYHSVDLCPRASSTHLSLYGTMAPSSRLTLPARSQHGIESLPVGVLSTIFILTLAKDEQLVKSSSAELTNPLLICAVSSLWRRLALSTPKLWRRVFVDLPDMSKSKAQLVPWIKRSGSLPLTLFIWYRSIPFPNGTGPRIVCVPMETTV